MIDPYYGTTVGSWLLTFWSRFTALFPGELFEDELQLGVLVPFGCVAGFLGVFLVAKRLTMMANALSHTMVLGIVLAVLCGSIGLSNFSLNAISLPLIMFFSVLVALLSVALTQRLSSIRGIREDASTAMIFSAFFAVAVILLSVWTRDAHVGPELLMGNPDALTMDDLYLVGGATCVVLLVGLLCSRGFVLAIFDEEFSLMTGGRPTLFIHILLMMVAISSIAAFRAIGFVMTLAFFTIPPLIAAHLTTTWRGQLICSSFVGAAIAFFSVLLSRYLLSAYSLSSSTSALAVVLATLTYVVVFLVSLLPGKGRTCLIAHKIKGTLSP